MKVEIYYRKFKPGKINFDMTQQDAGQLTMNDLLNDYACVAQIEQPESTTPDRIFFMYQDRPLPLPPGIEHTSMSVGDIVLLDKEICVCCNCGWYRLSLKSVPSGKILAG
ncbi:MAG: hypothetical protein PHN44_01240 [Candidatus Marinimicrobia bacterium]|nr:hypothetical protein [Candidatus Neomarinimicrobiota bacterium]MDD5539081.1 hypothetical protein [Candidatus Neomarinimicrobiota bacterium]